MSKEAMKLALDGKSLYDITGSITDIDKCIIHRFDLIQALAALAKQEQGEPVANASTWFALVMNATEALENASIFLRNEDAKRVAISGAKYYRDQAKTLYTTPYVPTGRQQRKPLTDEQIKAIADKYTVNMAPVNEELELAIELNDSCQSVHSFARAIEAAHGITSDTDFKE